MVLDFNHHFIIDGLIENLGESFGDEDGNLPNAEELLSYSVEDYNELKQEIDDYEFVIYYEELPGKSFFEKMESFKLIMNHIEKEYMIEIMPQTDSCLKPGVDVCPVYIDQKHNCIEFSVQLKSK